MAFKPSVGGNMQVGDLVKCKYSVDKSFGIVLDTRKIAYSLAIKVWSPDRGGIRWFPSKEYEVINE